MKNTSEKLLLLHHNSSKFNQSQPSRRILLRLHRCPINRIHPVINLKREMSHPTGQMSVKNHQSSQYCPRRELRLLRPLFTSSLRRHPNLSTDRNLSQKWNRKLRRPVLHLWG
jgi:hypothetical protein